MYGGAEAGGFLLLLSSSRSGDPPRRAERWDMRWLPCVRGAGSVQPILRGCSYDVRYCSATLLLPVNPSVSLRLPPPFTQGRPCCRSPSATYRGIPARSARMTGGLGRRWSLPWRNHMGDSSVALLPLNDGNSRCHGETNGGILRLLVQALNDVREGACGAGCGGNGDVGGAPSFKSSSRSGDHPVRRTGSNRGCRRN